MEDEGELLPQQPAITPAGLRFFKLPGFWTASPAAWFGVAEAQFLLRNIANQPERLTLVTAVLPEASARCVAHLLANPGDNCYNDLKAALLAAYQLTSFQKVERLFSAEPLGDCCHQSYSPNIWSGYTPTRREHLFSP